MLEKMKEIIAEQLGGVEDEITPDTSFKEDLGADSLDLFALTMALDEEYDTEIPAEELDSPILVMSSDMSSLNSMSSCRSKISQISSEFRPKMSVNYEGELGFYREGFLEPDV